MKEIKRLTVRSLTEKANYYFVPVYQRAFSWTSIEIRQLMTDISDSYQSDKPYYIGSLVVFTRLDESAEVIDGQQRLTALSILLAVLKNEFKLSSSLSLKIRYEARKDAELARDEIQEGKLSDNTFSSAYKIFLEELKKTEDIELFYNYLVDKVTILQIEVPKNIDLNLYFEAMNRHSFQILRSDIVRLKGESLLNNPKEKKVFNLIWEACSHFSSYVEEGMSFKLWNRMYYGEGHSPLFGVDYIAWWNMILTHVDGQEEKEDYTLDEIIRYESLENHKELSAKVTPDVHYSLTDYANFLLICANVLGYNFILDDKKMLSSYDTVDFFSNEESVKRFCYQLLRLRYLFDRYVIKESEKGTFALLQYLDLHEYRPSFKDREATLKCEALLLQLAKEYPTHEHLYYLVPLLKYLNENPELDGVAYYEFLTSFVKDWL